MCEHGDKEREREREGNDFRGREWEKNEREKREGCRPFAIKKYSRIGSEFVLVLLLMLLLLMWLLL